MQVWPMFVVVWFCVLLFVLTGILSFLDTAGIRRIPFPNRSKILFSALLLEVVIAGVAVFKHYVEQGSFPVFFSAASAVEIENIREFRISEQHQVDVVAVSGVHLNIFCKKVKVKNPDGKSTVYFSISSGIAGDQEIEVPLHEEREFVFQGQSYFLQVDGVIDWKNRADDAFISIRPTKS